MWDGHKASTYVLEDDAQYSGLLMAVISREGWNALLVRCVSKTLSIELPLDRTLVLDINPKYHCFNVAFERKHYA